MKIGRNDPCSCGSGKKFKNCCEKSGTPDQKRWTWFGIGLVVLLAAGAVAALHEDSKREKTEPPERVWSEEHQHWHTVTPTQPAPRPDGPAPPGKVWSEEHGHWHDAPARPPARVGSEEPASSDPTAVEPEPVEDPAADSGE